MQKRFAFIDLHKGWSLIFMIETHVFNAMLISSIKEASWFSILNFINGLIAPSFIFISGFAFMIASQRKMEEFRKLKFQFWRQLGRIFLILIAGYLLHMPYLSLHKMLQNPSSQEVINFLKVDVLQCIAVSLLFLFLLRLFIKKDKIFIYSLVGTLAAILTFSPFFWTIDFTNYMPLLFANYFNSLYGSLFPLFPWAGFMIAGALSGMLFIRARETNKEKEYFRSSLILFGILAIVTGILLLPNVLPVIKPNPIFFLMRVSLVMLLLVFFWSYEIHRKTERSFVLDISRESLLVYWLHLQIIYRKFWNEESLNSIINMNLNLWQAISATVLLILLMYVIARIWGNIKLKYTQPSRVLVFCSTVIISLIFLLN